MTRRLSVAEAFSTVPATCGDCAHWKRVEEDWGNCKEDSPKAEMLADENGDTYQVTFWPQVDRTESACGKWKAAN